MCINMKKGTEAIPNRDFWSAVPGYVKDGFVFTGESVGLVKKKRRRDRVL